MATSGASRHNLLFLIVMIGGQLLLITFGLRAEGGVTGLERFVMRVTSPVVTASQWAAGGVAGARGEFGALVSARAENRDLEVEVRRLRSELYVA